MGDALGAATEFLSLDDIRAFHGPSGLTTYDATYGRVGAITDDTQMTLFTAEGLLRATVQRERDGNVDVVRTVARAYARWLVTQGGPDIADPESGSCDTGWLITHLELHSPRAPGRTCLSALETGRVGTPTTPLNDSKGCGGVMRAAPAGIAARGTNAFALGVDCAAITHGHPTGYLAAGALAMIVGELIHGVALPDAVATTRAELITHPRHEETVDAIDAAVALAARGTPTPEQLESLGGGWVGEEALAIGLCCALVADDVRHGLLLAVNHSGDSDSTGAVAGNLLGAAHGVGAIPHDLLSPLELRDLVELIARDLADVFLDGHAPPIDRYPPD